jgi:hypothetical protein
MRTRGVRVASTVGAARRAGQAARVSTGAVTSSAAVADGAGLGGINAGVTETIVSWNSNVSNCEKCLQLVQHLAVMRAGGIRAGGVGV